MNLKSKFFSMIFIVAIFAGGLFTLQTPNKVFAGCESKCIKDAFVGPPGTACFIRNDLYLVFGDNDNTCLISNGTMTTSIATWSDNDPCDIGITSCGENKCIDPGSSADGSVCRIIESNISGLSCVENVVGAGLWDKGGTQCVQCDSTYHNFTNIIGNTVNLTNSNVPAGSRYFLTICGADAECNELKETQACVKGGVPGQCNANGVCETLALTLTLSAIAVPNPMSTSALSAITFTVEEGGVAVGGATVNGISVPAGDGTVSSGSCGPTNGSGRCTITYTAPATTGTYTISATKATKAGYTDSGPASVLVTVNSCPVTASISLSPGSCNVGDAITAGGRDTATGFALCLYDPSGGSDVHHDNSAVPNILNFNYTTDATGTWTATLEPFGPCPNFAAASSCRASTNVFAGGGGGGGGGATTCPLQLSCGVVGAGDVGCACGTAIAVAADIGKYCCAVTDTFYNTPALCNASPCGGGGGGCNNNGTQEAGEECDGADLAGEDCISRGFAGGSLSCSNCIFDTSLCTGGGGGGAACDPDSWFFCNPLRGSVETIAEAGETLLGYILGLIGSVALLFIIIAGVMYMTSAGNEERISSSKRILSGAAIGLMIALLAYGLLHVIMTVLGM